MSQLLSGIRFPIIQAPMLGITTPGMAAAVAESGGLGSLPIGGLARNALPPRNRVDRRATCGQEASLSGN